MIGYQNGEMDVNSRFLKFATPQEVFKDYISQIASIKEFQQLDIRNALNRVSYEDVVAPENFPGFRKSTVDGYALKARDTHGASDGLPALIQVVGEVKISQEYAGTLKSSEAVWVPTGGIVPRGADAVVMVEHTQVFGNYIEVMKPVAPGENVIESDEDIATNEQLVAKGVRFRLGHIHACLELGITSVKVYRKVKIGIISTGDEIVEPNAVKKMGQVRDGNTYALESWLKTKGGEAVRVCHVPDDSELLTQAVRENLNSYDVLVICGGSSVGTRDYTVDAIERSGKPGVIFHGVLTQPGKPTIFALVDEIPVLGLPGNPVSFMVSSRIFLTQVLRKREGECVMYPEPDGMVRLKRNVPSRQGRESYVRVKLKPENGELWAEPIFGESALVSNMLKADGVVRIPVGHEGIYAGEFAEFYRF